MFPDDRKKPLQARYEVWILLRLRIILSGEDAFKEDL